jgi:hypothetical protein
MEFGYSFYGVRFTKAIIPKFLDLLSNPKQTIKKALGRLNISRERRSGQRISIYDI